MAERDANNWPITEDPEPDAEALKLDQQGPTSLRATLEAERAKTGELREALRYLAENGASHWSHTAPPEIRCPLCEAERLLAVEPKL